MIKTKRGTTIAILLTTLILSILLCVVPLLKTNDAYAAVYDVAGSGNLACEEYNADGYRFSGSAQMQLAREALLGEDSFNK